MFQTQAKHSSTNNQLGEQYTNTTATFIMQIGMKKNGGCSLALLQPTPRQRFEAFSCFHSRVFDISTTEKDCVRSRSATPNNRKTGFKFHT